MTKYRYFSKFNWWFFILIDIYQLDKFFLQICNCYWFYQHHLFESFLYGLLLAEKYK